MHQKPNRAESLNRIRQKLGLQRKAPAVKTITGDTLSPLLEAHNRENYRALGIDIRPGNRDKLKRLPLPLRGYTRAKPGQVPPETIADKY